MFLKSLHHYKDGNHFSTGIEEEEIILMNDLLLDRLTMKKPVNLRGCSKFWYFVFAMFLLWFLLLCHFHSDSKNVQKKVTFFKVDHANSVDGPVLLDGKSEEKVTSNPIDNFFIGGDWDKYLDEIASAEKDSKPGIQIRPAAAKEEELIIKEVVKQPDIKDGTAVSEGSDSDSESCSGRYIYIYDLPNRFNEDLLRHCRSLNQWSDMCPFTSNLGFGPQLKNSEKVFSRTGWFETNQFMLEVIFHNKMKRYKCLTDDSSLASAIFVPYYAGLDVARFLWDSNAKMKMKDEDSLSLVKWVRERPEWKRMWGRDHFMVAGRITWDFRRLTNKKADWGNKLMILPEAKNMTMLTIESSPWNNNDFAIPYPTYFHPSNDDEVIRWQNRMKRMRRRVLFSFVGAPRPNMTDSIRREIIDQCQAARRNCRLLECIPGSRKCYKPAAVLRMFQNSVFCLQPSGDSYTRRSTFDSILAGCIPVFFHPGSAYVQYLWHLPKDYDKYSVFMPENKIKHEKASIEDILSRIPRAKVLAMRKQVIKLIPRVVYSDPRSARLQKFKDAFDLTIDGVLERTEKIRIDIREGKNFSAEVEELNWKESTPGGITEKHEWDPFFRRT